MKRKIFSVLMTAVVCFVMVFFAGCKSDKDKTKTNDMVSIVVTYVGEDYEMVGGKLSTTYAKKNLSVAKTDFNVFVRYEDGTQKELSETELEKVSFESTIQSESITNAGDYEVSFAYQGKTKTLEIFVDRATIDMSNVYWLYDSNNKFVYDGTYKTVEIQGYPDAIKKANINYTNNKKKEVGKYTAVASFEVNSNYYPVDDITLTWEIVA